MNEDYTYLTKEECEVCGSADNKVVYHYDDGSTTWHCFTPRCTNQNYKRKEMDERMKPLDMRDWDLIPNDMKSRGLTKEVLQYFGVLVREKDGRPNIGFPYFNEKGIPTAVKVKDPDKNFWVEGKFKDNLLYGQWKFPAGSRRIIIVTEGELDAIAAHQMTDYAAVSITRGASGAVKDVIRHVEYLESFDKVFICFDSDKPGQDAANEVIKVLDVSKVYRVNLRFKDPCEYAKMGGEGKELFRKDLNGATHHVPSSIFSPEEVYNTWLEYHERGELESDGLKTGIEALDEAWKLRPQEVTTIFSDTSVGKSSLTRQIAANYLHQYEGNVLYLAFEESWVKYYDKIVTMGLFGDEDSRKELAKLWSNRLIPANVQGYNPEQIEEAIKYGTRFNDVSLVILDNVTACCAGHTEFNQSARGIYALLVDLGKRYGHHTIVISHTKRDGNLKAGSPPPINAAFGSGGIEQFSDNVISLGREEGVDELHVAIRKQRENGDVGELQQTVEYDKVRKCFKGVNLIRNCLVKETEDNGSIEEEEAREFTPNDREVTEEGQEEGLSGLPERYPEDGAVRFQDGASDTPSSGGVFKSRSSVKKGSKPDKTVHSTVQHNFELQPRLYDNLALWTYNLSRSEGQFERYGQGKASKFTPLVKKPESYFSVQGCFPCYAPQNANDFPRMGAESWDAMCKRDRGRFTDSRVDKTRLTRYDK